MCYTFSTTKLPESVDNIQLSSAPHDSWVEDQPQGGQRQQRDQGASWASSNIDQLQASPDLLPSNSSRASAQAPRQYADQHPAANEGLHTQEDQQRDNQDTRLRGTDGGHVLASQGLTKHGPQEKGTALQYSRSENPMNSIKRQRDMTLKDEPPRAVGV